MALKIDMSKASDRMEWLFLEKMMGKLGFAERWINLIIRCVTSVTYNLLLNGEPTKAFAPTRGLRQGDPIYPYLFLICVEGLLTLHRKGESDGALQGVKVIRNCPSISHLLFADDGLLFWRSRVEEASKIKEILTLYEEASGKQINFDKSEITFSRNVHVERLTAIRDLLRVKLAEGHGKYLGVPVAVGRSKREFFNNIKDRIWNRIQW